MGGHVFVVRGDLTKLYCDAWLMPTDNMLSIKTHWYKDIPGVGREWKPGPARGDWKRFESRVMEVADWPAGEPRPWLVDVGGTWRSEVDWYMKGVREFFEKAAPAVRSGMRHTGSRLKPLLALPLVGTGGGGGKKKAGYILNDLLRELYEAACRFDVDIALTVKKGQDYAAAINARNSLGEKGVGIWPDELTREFQARAGELSERAKRAELVLFLGAGVSAGAGLPRWKGLLDVLAKEAAVFQDMRIEEERILKGFNALNPLDRARIISDHLAEKDKDSKKSIGRKVAELIGRHRCYCLSHALLAVLPVAEVVTTNYDALFELASQYARDTAPRVLPYQPSKPGSDRWILKLHGCVKEPQDIVLTRADYLRYDERRAALKGIVQAMLITRHMLFVGFSLTDDNFHRIIEEVRKAVKGDISGRRRKRGQSNPFGTALTPETNPFIQKLWKGDVNWIDFQQPSSREASWRVQEIFLDYLASISTSLTAHLFDRAYDGVLTPSEFALRSALENMVASVGHDVKKLPAWEDVERLIARFGGQEPARRKEPSRRRVNHVLTEK